MATDIDFKNIWKQQSSAKPSIEELLGKLKKFKNENLRRLILTNISLMATCMVIAIIWYRYPPQQLTAKLGIVFIILAMVIFLCAYNRMFMTFYRIDNTQSNSEYLQSLYTIRNKQKFMQTTMLNLYFIMLSMGIGLYMYQYASLMKPSSAAFAYAAVMLWVGFNWFYTRPRTVKKQQAKLDSLIHKFEELNQQFRE